MDRETCGVIQIYKNISLCPERKKEKRNEVIYSQGLFLDVDIPGELNFLF